MDTLSRSLVSRCPTFSVSMILSIACRGVSLHAAESLAWAVYAVTVTSLSITDAAPSFPAPAPAAALPFQGLDYQAQGLLGVAALSCPLRKHGPLQAMQPLPPAWMTR